MRGLIRRAAIRQAGLVRSDEFRAPLQVYGWLAKLLRWGNFRRVAEPLYYRLDRPHSFTSEYYISGSEDRKRAAWTTMFTGLLEAAMPLCRTPEERLFFQQVILTRIVAYPHFGSYADFSSSAPLIAECLQRLKFEGNSRLLTEQELPAVLHGLKERVDQIGLFDRSRIRRTFYQISQRARLARFLVSKIANAKS